MRVEEKSYQLKEKEKLDTLRIYKNNNLHYYSYNYKIKTDDEWKIIVRWDNFQQQPHVDTYDENENLVDSSPSRDKSLKEVLELIDIFGKNLVTMDISRL